MNTIIRSNHYKNDDDTRIGLEVCLDTNPDYTVEGSTLWRSNDDSRGILIQVAVPERTYFISAYTDGSLSVGYFNKPDGSGEGVDEALVVPPVHPEPAFMFSEEESGYDCDFCGTHTGVFRVFANDECTYTDACRRCVLAMAEALSDVGAA